MIEECKFGDILELHRGYDLTNAEMKSGNIPVAGSNGIIGYHDIAKIKGPCITLGRSGTIGKVHFYDVDIWPHNTSLFVSNFKSNYPKYIYYLLKSKNFEHLCDSSVVPSLNRNFIYPMKTLFHTDIKEQKEIANILEKLDEKINLNNRMNEKLEAMAKRLYDYWFVQFDFPNEDGKPYKSSGGKMVYNEQLKRNIPEGWEVKSVNDISTSIRGVTYNSTDEKSADCNDISLILRGNNISNNHLIFDSNTVYISNDMISKNQRLNKFDILMTMSSGSKAHVGKSVMFYDDSDFSFGAFCNKFVSMSGFQFILNQYFNSEYFKKYIYVTCSGTGINNLTFEHFEKSLMAIPGNTLLQQFNKNVENIYSKLGIIFKENQKLTNLRDKLLPLLMNGQVVTTE